MSHINDITPEKAAELLAAMGEQRRVRHGHVAALAACMSGGRFGVSTIMIDDDGRIVDGQHRLLAAVRSGTTIQVVVISGPRSELLDRLSREARTTKADDASKRLGRTVSTHAHAVMAHCGVPLEEAERLAALAYRTRGGGVALADALRGLSHDQAERFVCDLLRGTQPSAAVLGRWLVSHAPRPTVAQRAGITAACRVAIGRWLNGSATTEAVLTRAMRSVP